MLAKGTGCRQFATRIALYCNANDARSADEVPGMPLASDAPGAPAVEPPIAVGHAGAGGAVGVGVGVGTTVTTAGVVVNVRPRTLALVDVAETEVPCAVEVAAAAVVVEVGVEVEVEVGVEATAAGAVLPPRSAESAAELPAGAAEPATISALARDGATLTDGPAP